MKTSGLSIAMASLAAAVALASAPAQAQTAPFSANLVDSPMLMQVADGCGHDAWRGAWGHCHWVHGEGWGPHGYYEAGPWRVQAGPYWNAACPPGSWRGPWGHCRDTPYHGRLPDGGYKP